MHRRQQYNDFSGGNDDESFSRKGRWKQQITGPMLAEKIPELKDDEIIDWNSLEEAGKKADEEKFGHLPPVVFLTYKQDRHVAQMSKEEAEIFRFQNNKITVSFLESDRHERLFNPVRTFQEAFFPYAGILRLISRQRFEKPTPIQCQAWPVIMSGYDLIGIAQTGTGKTLAYLLPALLHIEAQATPREERQGPTCLILAPTRELAQQIHEQAVHYKYNGIRSVCVYGQGNRSHQRDILKKGIEIVVATPGRLIDFVDSGDVDLKGVSYIVLDEADRMLDMGFQPSIIRITSQVQPSRQTVLTSATWPPEVQYIARRLMKDPVKVNVGDLDLAAVETVSQRVRVCEADDKLDMLLDELQLIRRNDKIIVFANRKSTVDYLSVMLLEHDIPARVMHGGIEQCDRESALDDLRTGVSNILLATDVASRGLDVQDVTKVINLDLPKNLEEYVHRAGRTGRAGKTGEAVSFVCWDDKHNVNELIDILERTNQEISEELRHLARRAARFLEKRREERMSGGGRGRGRGGGGRFMGGF